MHEALGFFTQIDSSSMKTGIVEYKVMDAKNKHAVYYFPNDHIFTIRSFTEYNPSFEYLNVNQVDNSKRNMLTKDSLKHL